MKAATLVALWIALGFAQVGAYLEGLHIWLGIGSFLGLLIFFGTSSLPFGAVAGTIVSFYGAYAGWQWAWWQASLLAFPFAILSLTSSGAGAIGYFFSTARGYYRDYYY